MNPKTTLDVLLLAGLPSLGILHAAVPAPAFEAARPVWPEGRETERNLLVEFRAGFEKPAPGPVTLRLAGATLYRFFVNGQFGGHGPARAGHGFYRVDEWDITPKLRTGRNEVVIEVAGYNANSYYLLDQPSFLQAELVAGGKVIAATGRDGFTANIRHDRVQKVQRYSFQRPFSEVWRLPAQPAEPARCAIEMEKPLAPRRVPYPAFDVRRPVAHIAGGEVQKGDLHVNPWKDRSLTQVGPKLAGFSEAELATIPSLELQAVKTVSSRPAAGTMPFTLKANSYHTLDFGVNLSGFIGARITVRTRTRLFLTFDEILSGGDVDFERLGCVNIVLYELEPGAYSVESFEPYTLRYLKLIVLEGDCDISDCYLRELANPEADRARFIASDERLNRIFEAARQSFRQNATDLFMDCPSRERAGWLCDSFFTARVEADLCGDTRVEKNFPEVHQANAFIGNQLGFELLSRDGRGQQILDEAIGYWLYMADRTGTLWENDTPEASCNHGFASHAAHVLIRDVLGLHSVDTIGRSIQLRFSALKLDECRGSIPTPAGPIELEWNKAGGKFTYRLITPPGYKVGIENLTGLPLMKE